ncbi:hypothetical protein K402DRAFT_435568 [Aulographum hederae CBS 113979]|uniref:Uncharacterized protein n=1 Tax=Aulographum hederae CBS 113979 TaxID=1176131 RepID=A0A6G1GS07_9PEZI|nr:hypothetical protein K402DRAFT_435568 [Aulographum hederae CBS 113979]
MADYLLSLDYQSGSIWAQRPETLHPNASYWTYQGNDRDQGLSILLSDDNSVSLWFLNARNTTSSLGIDIALPIAEVLFDNRVIWMASPCIYPLSGQYDMLCRWLYYCLLVLSFLVRHNWIATAALGTAMTYSAVAAFHLFVLLGRYDFKAGNWAFDLLAGDPRSSKAYGDPDFFAIFAILQASAIMLIPILNWSSSVRRHQSRAILLCWATVILTGLSLCEIYVFKWWSLNILWSLISCPISDAAECTDYTNLTTEQYRRCSCIDFCALHNPSAPLRGSSSMVPLLARSVSYNNLDLSSGNLTTLVDSISVYVLFQGFIAMLEVKWSQSQIRNGVFHFLSRLGRRNAEYSNIAAPNERPPLSTPSHKDGIQTLIAKLIASSLYIGAALGGLFFPFLFLVTIITNELWLGFTPSSERSDAIGAWGSWLAAALVLTAGIIGKFHKAWFTEAHAVLESLHGLFRRKPPSSSQQVSADDPQSRHRHTYSVLEYCKVPYLHTWNILHVGHWTVSHRAENFVAWWNDPESYHHHNDEGDYEGSPRPTSDKPSCSCCVCDVRKHQHDSHLLAGTELNTFEEGDPEDLQALQERLRLLFNGQYEIVETNADDHQVQETAVTYERIPRKPVPVSFRTTEYRTLS